MIDYRQVGTQSGRRASFNITSMIGQRPDLIADIIDRQTNIETEEEVNKQSNNNILTNSGSLRLKALASSE